MNRLSLTFMIAVSTATMAGAESGEWSYADCVDYAREHNISIRKSRLSEQTGVYDIEEAKAQWQPTLDFATSHTYTNTPWGKGDKNVYASSYGFNAGWTVWNGGERENNIRRSVVRSEIDRINTAELLRGVETDILEIYLNILYAREAIAISREAVALSEAQADRARQLMEAGKMSRVDYSRLNSQCEQDRYELVSAQATLQTRRMELKQILELGIDTELCLKPLDGTDELVMAELPPIADSYEKAIDTDMRLRGLEAEKKSSEIDVAIARAGNMPRISLNAGVGTGFISPGDSGFGTGLKQAWNENIGLTLSIPILDNRKTKTAVARSRVAQLDAQLDIDNRMTQLSQLIEASYTDTRSAQARYIAAQQQLESARLTDELTNEQFALGYVNTVELMTAHNAYVEAQHAVLQAKYMAILGQKMIEFYRTAKITL